MNGPIPKLPPEARGQAAGRGRLAGRRILVVGAGQVAADDPGPLTIGNGRAISLLCAREGAVVALSDIRKESVIETAGLVAAAGGKAIALLADATDPGAVHTLVERASEAMGGLDGVVAVVGSARPGDLDSTSVDDWDWTFRTNVRSHFLVLQATLGRLESGASIVLLSSIAAAAPVHGIVAYHASKAALEGIKTVTAKLAATRGVRLNIVAPGTIDTPTAQRGMASNPDYRATVEAAAQRIPLGRRGTGWEVAYATVFLLSDEASFITGHTLFVDGGYLALRG